MLLKTLISSKLEVFITPNYFCFNKKAFWTGLFMFEEYYSISLMKSNSGRNDRIAISLFTNGFISLNVC